MAEKLKAPRGTFDVLPEDAARRSQLEHDCASVVEKAGYRRIETPVFEDTEVFTRGVGEATDIVKKQMFTFEDAGGRSVTLRPEGTAPLCRAYVEHGMHKWPQPVKLWYWGPFFRYEAPQAGRYRQFWQVGAEAVGSDDPSVDAELILLLAELLTSTGVGETRLRLSSLGSPETRAEYREDLRAYLRRHENRLSTDVRERIDLNPLRAFDADHEGTRAVMVDAPRLLHRLATDDAQHFAEVRALLDESGLTYEIDPTLVRGLDYYTRTVFEFESDRLGAQRGVGGGGRYDLLVEQLGGPPTPAVGWAAGIERILIATSPSQTVTIGPAVEIDEARPIGVHGGAPRVFIATAQAECGRKAFAIARRLRQEGHHVLMDQAGRSLKGQLRHADRIHASATVIVGIQSFDVKDMETGKQSRATTSEEVVALVSDVLA